MTSVMICIAFPSVVAGRLLFAPPGDYMWLTVSNVWMPSSHLFTKSKLPRLASRLTIRLRRLMARVRPASAAGDKSKTADVTGALTCAGVVFKFAMLKPFFVLGFWRFAPLVVRATNGVFLFSL
jgi:hypothetical protein